MYREVVSFVASKPPLLATDIESLMLKAVRYRFKDYKTSRTIEFSSDRGSIYRAHSVKNLANHLGLDKRL
jgi:putative transposase